MAQQHSRYGQYPNGPAPPPHPFPPHPPSHTNPARPIQPTPSLIQTTPRPFKYDSSRIPGLGIENPPSYGGLQSPSGAASWTGQAAPSQAPIASVQSGYYPPTVSMPNYSTAHSFSATNHHIPGISPSNMENHVSKQIQQEESKEEGELSEGELEDIYLPQEDDEPVQPGSFRSPRHAMGIDSTRDTSMADSNDTPLYEQDEDDEGGEQNEAPNLKREGRERTGSYSPCLSPREVQSESAQTSIMSTSVSDANCKTQIVPSSDRVLQPKSAEDLNSDHHRRNAHQERSPTPVISYDSVLEAKKEAQKAILKLLPLGVKYQHYIDEGFDKKVVKALFTELHLISSDASDTRSPQITAATPAETQGKGPTSLPASTSDKSEERKDRIARLLKAKAADKAGSASATPPPRTSAVEAKTLATVPSNSGPLNKTKTKKDPETQKKLQLLLQQKMEALQKSREAHKPKIAAGQEQSKPGSPVDEASLGQPTLPAKTEESLETMSTDEGQLLESTKSPSISSPQGAPGSSSIPGLFLDPALQPSLQPSSQRKRPVAADFVDYPASTGGVKRQFRQHPPKSSFVIHVTDGSDDEDIEMEVESPTDGPSTSAQREDVANQHASFRDFPPLSNLPSKERISSNHTPTSENSTGNGKPKKSHWQLLKEIDEMKKKIAKAEARLVKAEAKKRTAGASSASSTSNNAGVTPIPLEQHAEAAVSMEQRAISLVANDRTEEPSEVALEVPKRSALNTDEQILRQRRVSIISQQLPRVEATLQEKARELGLFQQKVAQLQAEIDKGLAEKQRLTQEIENLAGAPSTGPQATKLESADSETSSAEPIQSADSVPRSEAITGRLGSERVHLDEPTDNTPPKTMLDVSSESTQPFEPSGADSGTNTNPVGSGAAQTVDGHLAGEEMSLPGPMAGEEVNMASQHRVSPPQTAQDTASDSYEPPEAVFDDTDAASPSLDVDLENIPLPSELSHVKQLSNSPVQDEMETVGENKPPTVPVLATPGPYESPLKCFHAYRFHPKFDEAVAGGLRSLTYSNRIDPNWPFCPYELDGLERHDDTSCRFQHFGYIVVPDDTILLELGDSNSFSGEQKERFLSGMTELWAKFRTEKIEDFASVSRSIVNFRNQFLGDPSKVLNLGNIRI